MFSLSETLREVSLVKYWTFLIGGITMALAIVLAFIFMFSVAKPVLRLRSLMKRVEQGDLAVRFAGDGGDEIAELGLGFDEMIERIQSLIEQVYSEQRSKREAELRILQEQDQATLRLQHPGYDPMDGAGAPHRRRGLHGRGPHEPVPDRPQQGTGRSFPCRTSSSTSRATSASRRCATRASSSTRSAWARGSAASASCG